MRLRSERVENAVLQTLEGEVLQPAVIIAIVDAVLDETCNEHELDRLRRELQDVERELTNLAKAIAAGGPLETILVAVKAKEAQRSALTAAIAAQQRMSSGLLKFTPVGRTYRLKGKCRAGRYLRVSWTLQRLW